MEKIKILIVDDHQMFIDGLAGTIEDEKSFKIVGCANDGKEAIRKIRLLEPDLVILDINMPELDGYKTTKYIVEHFKNVKILVLSMYDDLSSIKKMLDEGANGYLFKNTPKKELITAIKQTMTDGSYVNSQTLKLLLRQSNKSQGNKRDILTAREIDILKLIAKGYQNSEIAEKLFISIFTVKSHRKNILSKLELRNTAGLVRYAIEKGVLD